MDKKQMFHAFNIQDAEKFGIVEATLLANIRYWIEHNRANGNNYYDGRYWTYNSINSWTKLFPYLTAKQIRKALQNLIEADILVTGNYNYHAYDRTLWYSINDPEVNSICPTGKMDLPYEENGFAPQGEPIPDINTNIKHNNIMLKQPKQEHKEPEQHRLNEYIKNNFPDTVARMKVQMTAEQCEKLKAKLGNEGVIDILERMDTWEPLLRKRKDVYRTALAFSKNNFGRKK